MTYSPTKPDPGPSPRIDVSQIQTNFSKFASIFSSTVAGVNYNHTALNNVNQGDHESIIFSLQNNDPGVTQSLCVLYCKNGASNAGTQPQLFAQIPKFLPKAPDVFPNPNLPIRLTYNTVNTVGPNQFQSFLPRGALPVGASYDTAMYLLYMGTTNDITTNITLNPAPTSILIAIATPNNLTSPGTAIPYNVSTQIISNSQFKINSTLNAPNVTPAYNFTWMAIAIA